MSSQADQQEKMGFNATWSMAVGGMVGGGIFSVLGVVIQLAGAWAWLSFVLAGLIALVTGYSYVRLAATFEEGGGAFTFLREIDHKGLAGSLSWVLIVGYILTLSVYAFTFGHYLGYVVGLGAWFDRVAALVIVAVLVGVNLLGVGEAAGVEIIAVWGKLAVLVGLAAIGLWRWHPAQLRAGIQGTGLGGALMGAASVFMAYEGFQLLTYDYDDIENPKRTLHWATLTAIVVVIGVYVMVALGTASLVGAGTIVEQKEVALAVAGEAALGTIGKILVTVAAVFSTASAINATLFATARLAGRVADDGELPQVAAHRNDEGIPDRAVLALGAMGAGLAMLGSLSMLVEAASLAFLFTFGVVNVIAFQHLDDRGRWLAGVGALGASVAALLLIWRLITSAPLALGALAVLVLIATVGRPYLLQYTSSGTA